MKIFYLGTKILCHGTLPLIVLTAYISVFCHKLWSKQEQHYIHWKETIAKLNDSSYEYHYFGASTFTVADLVLMAVLSVTNVGSANW